MREKHLAKSDSSSRTVSPTTDGPLQGQAELTIFGASDRYRTQLENTEIQWLEAQRRQSELTALSQAIMLLIGALAVILMLWMASGGVGGNAQPAR